jgi:predicted DCC family thiol-disulfide oxidoreductase YuxK
VDLDTACGQIKMERDEWPMKQPVLLYDSDCGFCRWSLGKVLAWDRRRRLRPVTLQSPEADALLQGMPEDVRMSSWHLADTDGVHSAGAGIAPLLRLLPGGSPLAAVAARTPRGMERLYRFVAGNRSVWGKLVTDGAKRRADRRIASRLHHQDAATGGRPS